MDITAVTLAWLKCYHLKASKANTRVLSRNKLILVCFQTLLDGCCSDSILTLGEDGHFHLDVESTAVVQDLKLLSEILLDWKIWAKAQVNTTM